MELLLLADNNVIDFSKVLENGLVGVLIILFAMQFVKPLLKSFLATNEQNAKSNSDNVVALTTMATTVAGDHKKILANQEAQNREAAQYQKELLERLARCEDNMKQLFQELAQEVKARDS